MKEKGRVDELVRSISEFLILKISGTNSVIQPEEKDKYISVIHLNVEKISPRK